MMPRHSKGDQPQALDLILSGASSSVAVYAAGVSLASDANAVFFASLVLVGTIISLLVVTVIRSQRLLSFDTLGYVAAALLALFLVRDLNTISPEPIFTGPLQTAGILCWMLCFGSAVVWRDQTMLFQAVPALALFGLVGCYDTFRASVIYFFAFLVFQATLMARAHGRVMLRQAQLSGREASSMEGMRQGPWRWMAGPEWALASALTIVLISIVGAPLLRESAKGFSGLVRYTPVLPQNNQSGPTGAMLASTRVGLGPRTLSDVAVLRATLPEPLYLRSFVYGSYDRGMWTARNAGGGAESGFAEAFSLERSKNRTSVRFRIEPLLLPGGTVPIPGEVGRTNFRDAGYVYNPGGSLTLRSDPPFPPIEGTVRIYDGATKLSNADTRIAELVPDYLQTSGTPADVAALARQVTRNAKSDYEMALAIKSAIETRVRYNLDAPVTPADQDPVSYFLFKSKEGYCDLFASSMVLMARAVGLPARYVVGYYPFESSKDDRGRYIVRQKDAHAWCEIFFDEGGWVVFDATEGADSVEGNGRGSSGGFTFWKSPWIQIPLATLVAAAGLFFGVRRLRAYIDFRKSPAYAVALARRAEQRQRARVGRTYSTFERELRKAIRRPRGFAETILEYAGAAGPKLGARAESAKQVSLAFVSAMYATPHVDDERLSALRSMVRTFKREKSGGRS